MEHQMAENLPEHLQVENLPDNLVVDMGIEEMLDCVFCDGKEEVEGLFKCLGPNCVFMKVFNTPTRRTVGSSLVKSFGRLFVALKLRSYLTDLDYDGGVSAAWSWALNTVNELYEDDAEAVVGREAKSLCDLVHAMAVGILPMRPELKGMLEQLVFDIQNSAGMAPFVVAPEVAAPAPVVVAYAPADLAWRERLVTAGKAAIVAGQRLIGALRAQLLHSLRAFDVLYIVMRQSHEAATEGTEG